MYGYAGKIASIDLSSGSIADYAMTDHDRERFLGGKTLAAKIVYDMLPGRVEAFSENNIIVITTSPLTGSTAPCSSRFNISTISPLTGLLASSNCGGNFGLSLKRAGYDGLIVRGKSPEKVYLDITDGGIAIRNAAHLWGKTTGEAQALMAKPQSGTLAIGPAGEHLVRYASVLSQERAAGRAGIGAVFGFKNVKGMVAAGDGRIDIYDSDKLTRHNRQWVKTLQKHPLTGTRLPQLGTAWLVRMMQRRHLLATRNYAHGQYADFDRISGETLRQDYLIKNKGCVTCPIQCGRVVEAYGKPVKGPELETLGLLGSNLLNHDLRRIINVNHLCDEYGLDTISFGSSVGLAMELNERGLWDNGLHFGDASQLEDLVKSVAAREGIGDELAEGTRRMSQKYGGSDVAMHVKGLEIAAYEPRAAQGMGLGYATSNRGGCHLNGGYLVVLEGLGLNISGNTIRGKAAFTIFFQDLMEAISAGGTCLFTSYTALPTILLNHPEAWFTRLANTLTPYVGVLASVLHNNPWLMELNVKSLMPYPASIQWVTGFKMTIGRFLRVGERGYNLERLINIRQGVKGSDDTLPARLTDEIQRADDPGSTVKLSAMLRAYYRIRGWDGHGIPTPQRLKKLGLEGYHA